MTTASADRMEGDLVLVFQQRMIDLNRPVLVGRGEGCDVRLDDDPLASREHARFSPGPAGVFVEDLMSTNGLFVDEYPIVGRRLLRGGERVRIGSSDMTVRRSSFMERAPRSSPFARTAGSGPASGEVTKPLELLDVIGTLVDKALRAGDAARAAGILDSLTPRLMSSTDPVPDERLEELTALATRLARETGGGRLIDLVIRLHEHASRIPSQNSIDLIYDVAHHVDRVDVPRFRSYMKSIAATAGKDPALRFRVRRLEGLLAQLDRG